MRTVLSLALLGVLLSLATALPVRAQCTTEWDDPVDGLWTDPLRWSAGVPGPTDNACVVTAGTYTVTATTDISVRSLTFGSAAGMQTLLISGSGTDLTIADSSATSFTSVVTWTTTTGTLSGARLTNRGQMNLSGVRIIVATLVNEAGLSLTGPNDLQIGQDGVLDNRGTVFFETDNDIVIQGSGPRTFLNSGIIRKTGGTATSHIADGITLDTDGGTFDVESGRLRLFTSGTHTNARLDAAAGTTLSFGGGTHTLAGEILGIAEGTVQAEAGVVLSVTDTTRIDLDLNGFVWAGTLSNEVLLIGGGTLRNRGLLVPSGGRIAGATLLNEGLIELRGPENLRLGQDGVLDNRGTFDVLTDNDLRGQGSGPRTFRNSGDFRKTGGTATTQVVSGITFENTGTVEVRTGTLSLEGASIHTFGILRTTAADATLRFDGESHTFVGGVSGTQVGILTALPGTTFSIPGDPIMAFDGTGFQWMGILSNEVLLVGGGTLRNRGLLVPSGGRIAGATLLNEGLIELRGPENLRLGQDGVLDNRGTFDVLTDHNLRRQGSGPRIFRNSGAFRKTGGTATTQIESGITFENSGTIEVDAGMLLVEGVFDHQAAGRLQGSATFAPPASYTYNGKTAPGSSPGTLSWAGDYTPSAPSTLFIELGGLAAGTEHDRLAVTGTAALDGALTITHVQGYFPQTGDAYTVVTAGSVTGTFATINAPDGYTYDVTYNPADVVLTVASIPNLDLQANNTSPLTVAPGGTVAFSYAVRNNTAGALTGQLWFVATGGASGVIRSGTLPGVTQIAGTYTQPIPGTTPPGTYTYRLRVGNFPSAFVDEVAFMLVVAPAEGPVARDSETWAVTEASPWRLPSGAVVPSEAEGVAAEAAASEILPAAFALTLAGPNPFRDQTTFHFALQEPEVVRLVVYDALGREVVVIVEDERAAGTHTATLQARGLPAGVYFVQLTSANQSDGQRVLLVR